MSTLRMGAAIASAMVLAAGGGGHTQMTLGPVSTNAPMPLGYRTDRRRGARWKREIGRQGRRREAAVHPQGVSG